MQGYSTTPIGVIWKLIFAAEKHNADIVYTWIQYLNAGGKLIENFFYYHGN